jgi:hypothetical protein
MVIGQSALSLFLISPFFSQSKFPESSLKAEEGKAS